MGMQQCWVVTSLSVDFLSVGLHYRLHVFRVRPTPVLDILAFKSDCLKGLMETNFFKSN